MNDVPFSLRLVIFGSKVRTALLYTDNSKDWRGRGERREGCHPSGLLCWLAVRGSLDLKYLQLPAAVCPL